MKNKISLLALATVMAFSSLFAGCDGDEERYEVIDKLRALGVASNPVVSTPSTAATTNTTTLTFFAAVPLGDEVTAEAFIDGSSKYASTVDLQVDTASAKYEDHASFRLYQIAATFKTPTLAEAPILPSKGFNSLRYGMLLRSGDEEERIVGNALVYPDDSDEAKTWKDWEAPKTPITAPEQDASVNGDVDLTASVDDISDNWRVSWFVGKGKVKNRRAKSTTWETDGGGNQTVIFTARDLKSGAFIIQPVDVSVD